MKKYILLLPLLLASTIGVNINVFHYILFPFSS